MDVILAQPDSGLVASKAWGASAAQSNCISTALSLSDAVHYNRVEHVQGMLYVVDMARACCTHLRGMMIISALHPRNCHVKMSWLATMPSVLTFAILVMLRAVTS